MTEQCQTLDDLMHAVAKHLTGRSVKIRYRDPIWKGDLAAVQVDPGGCPVVDISPVLNGDNRELYIFLHELAHAKLHAHNFRRVNVEAAAQSATVVRHGQAATAYKTREYEADQLAWRWLEYGKQKQPGGAVGEFEGVLWALLKCKNLKRFEE